MSRYEILIRASEDYIGAAEEMDRAVNDFLADGWQLHGPTQMSMRGSEAVFVQVMVRLPEGIGDAAKRIKKPA